MLTSKSGKLPVTAAVFSACLDGSAKFQYILVMCSCSTKGRASLVTGQKAGAEVARDRGGKGDRQVQYVVSMFPLHGQK